MASETLVLDPTSEDSTNTQLTLTDSANGIDLLADPPPDYGNPDRDRLFAGSADTFGDPLVQSRYRNRQITLTVRCYGTEAVMRARVRELTKKVGKIAQYGGTLKRTLNDATTITFDLLDADVSVPADWMFLQRNSVTCAVTLLAKPAGRGAATTYSTSTETTNPELIFQVVSPAGDLPALGQLVIDDAQGKDQWFVQWGMQSVNYPGTGSGTTTAALAYAATGRLAYNGSTALAVTGAASGTIINCRNLTGTYSAISSTTSSGTAYATHVGSYRVFARLRRDTVSPAGSLSAALEWGVGDLARYVRNQPVSLPYGNQGQFFHVDLGMVTIPKVVTGSQRWEGRLIAKVDDASIGLGIDRWYLVPTDDGYAEARGIATIGAATTFTARDEFAQTAGVLAAKTLPQGGTWAGAGDADDFSVETAGKTAQRTAITDGATNGRYAIAGSTTLTSTVVQVDAKWSTLLLSGASGVIARYIDTNNWMMAQVTDLGVLLVYKRVAGTITSLYVNGATANPPTSSYSTIKLMVTASGRFYAYYGLSSSPSTLTLLLEGYDSDLATGGVLASGKTGFYDENTGGAATRNYDNFAAWAPGSDAAAFASQSLRIQHNAAVREDSAGAIWQPVSSYRGSYLRVPAANTAGTCRLLVKGSRTEPLNMGDPNIDDISATLTVTPLYLSVP